MSTTLEHESQRKRPRLANERDSPTKRVKLTENPQAGQKSSTAGSALGVLSTNQLEARAANGQPRPSQHNAPVPSGVPRPLDLRKIYFDPSTMRLLSNAAAKPIPAASLGKTTDPRRRPMSEKENVALPANREVRKDEDRNASSCTKVFKSSTVAVDHGKPGKSHNLLDHVYEQIQTLSDAIDKDLTAAREKQFAGLRKNLAEYFAEVQNTEEMEKLQHLCESLQTELSEVKTQNQNLVSQLAEARIRLFTVEGGTVNDMQRNLDQGRLERIELERSHSEVIAAANSDLNRLKNAVSCELIRYASLEERYQATKMEAQAVKFELNATKQEVVALKKKLEANKKENDGLLAFEAARYKTKQEEWGAILAANEKCIVAKDEIIARLQAEQKTTIERLRSYLTAKANTGPTPLAVSGSGTA